MENITFIIGIICSTILSILYITYKIIEKIKNNKKERR
jgi:hypothetical protein